MIQKKKTTLLLIMVKMPSNSDAWHDSVLSDEIQNVLMLMNDDNSFSSSTFDLPLRHVSVVWSVVSFSSSEGYGFVSLVHHLREPYLVCNCLFVCVCVTRQIIESRRDTETYVPQNVPRRTEAGRFVSFISSSSSSPSCDKTESNHFGGFLPPSDLPRRLLP